MDWITRSGYDEGPHPRQAFPERDLVPDGPPLLVGTVVDADRVRQHVPAQCLRAVSQNGRTPIGSSSGPRWVVVVRHW